MVNTKFEAYKIKRELKRSGVTYEFKRPKKNDFDEPTKELDSIGKVVGLYHEQNSYVQIATGNNQQNTTQIRTKKMPMILCLYEDVAPLKLQVGDRVKINSNTFRIVNVANIQEWNIIADISLEVVDVGIQA